MKRILILLLCTAFLAGCGASTAVETTAPSSAPTEPSTAPTEIQTEPPGPVFDAYKMATEMTLEQRVGQIFLAACTPSTALADVSKYHLGGYILFADSFEGRTPEKFRNTIDSYQAAAEIPLLIAVDEEGGTVCRASAYSQFRSQRFPSPRKLYDQGGLELVLSTEEEKCNLLTSLGINANASPVCDITTDPNAFMYSRSLGQSPEETGRFVAGMLDVMHTGGVAAILKHFPGYGNNTDTHVGIAVDNRSLEQLESADLVPFAAGIQSGAGAIMVSHTFINAIDPDYPATLSSKVHQYLREEMDFDGVIVTDDLSMGAITSLYGKEEAAVLAVLAGNDLLCTWSYRPMYTAVLEAVQSGRILEETLNQAVARVLQWKYDMGLITFP